MIKARASRLREVGAKALARHLDGWVGREAMALVEEDGAARLSDFTRVRLPVGAGSAGDYIRVRLAGHDGEALSGTVL